MTPTPFRAAAAAVLAAAAAAQGPVLDVLDGETLYDGGWLVSLTQSIERRDTLRQGSRRVHDDFASHERELATTLGVLYGLRNDLQVAIALSYRDNERRTGPISLPGGGGSGPPTPSQDAAGIGDLALLAKYRFLRLDGPGFATNFAAISGVTLPTGDDDQQHNGVELEPELQPGSGGIDPMLGAAVTHEPGRWRYNAAAMYTFHTDTDDDGDRLGDEFVAELSVGNRFWLEPYPGPFMRLDAVLRYYHEDEARQDGVLPDTGGQRYAAGLNWAFRPRPELDLQLYGEIPIHEDVNGTQLGHDWLAQFTIGYRF